MVKVKLDYDEKVVKIYHIEPIRNIEKFLKEYDKNNSIRIILKGPYILT